VADPDWGQDASSLQDALGGQYRLERPIGSGGMADVWLATDLRSQRSIALKVLRAEVTDLAARERFKREVSFVARLSHPNIVPLHDSGAAGSYLYFAMPLVAGESLRQRLARDGALPLELSLRIAADVAAALEYAHGQGIIHRDIKPENILLQEDQAFVTDFGIAKAAEVAAGEQLTSASVAIGTVAYMSPEQASSSTRIDRRSDLYSLALVVYEMLAGDVPFHGNTPEAMLARKAVGQYPSIRTLRPSVSRHVDECLARALSPVPAERQTSVAAFAAALTSPPSRLRKPSTRQAAIAAVILATVGASAFHIYGQRTGTDHQASLGLIVVAPLENRTADSSFEVVSLMAADWITVGLQRNGQVKVLSTQGTLDVLQRIPRVSRSGGLPVRLLSEETGAQTIVGGSFYRRGDSLLFRLDVTDRHGTSLMRTVTDVAAPTSDPLSGIEELRNRLLGLLALHADDRMSTSIAADEKPPTYAAYRAFAEGLERYSAVDNAAALELFLEAFALDTTFTAALLHASIALTNLGDWARADSMLRIVEQRRHVLSEHHRAWLDYRAAFVRGRNESALRAIRLAASHEAGSRASYNHAVTALQSGYYHEAVQVIGGLSPDRGPMRDFAPYWTVFGAALHALGDFERERNIGVEARRRHPDRLASVAPLVRALAAKGRIAELANVVRDAEGLPEDPSRWDFGHLVVEAAEELRAHGHAAEGRRYLERAATWLRGRPSSVPTQWRIAQVLAGLERYEEALIAVRLQRTEHPSHIDLIGTEGVLLARLGRADYAQRLSDSLALLVNVYDYGAANVYRARIAAVSGQPNAAMAYLREALSQGKEQDLWLHRDPDLESLRGHPGFVTLVRGRK
jgi:tetratricopeptide (TPR) repeat protein